MVLLSLVIATGSGFAQAKDSAELVKRLDVYMQYNRDKDFEKVLDYTYPKLFDLASRDQLKQVLESVFKSEAITVTMDSLRIVKIYPIFTIGTGRYAKITYYMRVGMTAKGDDGINMEAIAEAMKAQMGAENVTYDAKTKTVLSRETVPLVAIIDELSPTWTFMNAKKDDPMMDKLLKKEVLDKLNSY